MALIRAGWHLAIALRVCWWSFVPVESENTSRFYDSNTNLPSAFWAPLTAWSSLSHLKKLPIAHLHMLIFKSHARRRVWTKSRLMPWSSGNLSPTLWNNPKTRQGCTRESKIEMYWPATWRWAGVFKWSLWGRKPRELNWSSLAGTCALIYYYYCMYMCVSDLPMTVLEYSRS